MMSELIGEGAGRRGLKPRDSSKIIFCKECGKTDTIKRYTQYIVVGYYGKEY